MAVRLVPEGDGIGSGGAGRPIQAFSNPQCRRLRPHEP
jgi:hypothetical protein